MRELQPNVADRQHRRHLYVQLQPVFRGLNRRYAKCLLGAPTTQRAGAKQAVQKTLDGQLRALILWIDDENKRIAQALQLAQQESDETAQGMRAIRQRRLPEHLGVELVECRDQGHFAVELNTGTSIDQHADAALAPARCVVGAPRRHFA